MKKLLLTFICFLSFATPAQAFNGAVLLPCPFVNQAQVDPIVSPGAVSHHMHDFFGGGPVTSTTTSSTLRAGNTSCQIKSDRAAYWVPSVVKTNGEFAKPTGFAVYYRAAMTTTSTTRIQPFPPELAFVSGNPRNTDKFKSAGNWRCTGGSPIKSIPTNCGGKGFQLTFAFARCWDGVTLKSSVTPSPYMRGTLADGSCPSTHPVPLPQLSYIINWGPDAVGGRLSSDILGSPAGSSLHGDFMNGWNPQSSLQAVVDKCLNVNTTGTGTVSCNPSGSSIYTSAGVFVTN